jgi:hypothetical protein
MVDVTVLLAALSQGDPSTASQLLPLVCEELRRLAAQKLANEKPGQMLEPTALVHEVTSAWWGASRPAPLPRSGKGVASSSRRQMDLLAISAQLSDNAGTDPVAPIDCRTRDNPWPLTAPATDPCRPLPPSRRRSLSCPRLPHHLPRR